jgi:hypothetical protein
MAERVAVSALKQGKFKKEYEQALFKPCELI